MALEADHVLTITQALADELVEMGVHRQSITLLPNAVDPEQFFARPKDQALLDQFGITPADFTLVYAGSLTPYEGLDDLIAAIGLLKKSGRRVKLIIVGDGHERVELARLVQLAALEREVIFVGRVSPSDVARYWSLADAVALPRKDLKVCRIVSPLKPFEVMAMRLPLIVSDLPVMHEIVRDGETGRICRPGNPSDLALVIEQLALDPEQRGRLGEAGRQWILQHRTWSSNAENLRTIYEGLGYRVNAAPASLVAECALAS
jgi:glycosyltransferase involved in cell wall biosynthesis